MIPLGPLASIHLNSFAEVEQPATWCSDDKAEHSKQALFRRTQGKKVIAAEMILRQVDEQIYEFSGFLPKT